MTTEPETVPCPFADDGCRYRDHILVDHLRKKHGITEPAKFMTERANNGEPFSLWSAFGLQKLQEQHPESMTLSTVPRDRTTVRLNRLFTEFADMAKDDTCDVFASAGEMTPPLDPDYIFPKQATLQMITVLEMAERNNVWISGPTGTGKTQLAMNLAAKLRAEVWRYPCNAYITANKLMGSPMLKEAQHGGVITYFKYGVIPQAMRRGCWLLLDEFDTLDAKAANVLKPMLENPSVIVLEDNGGEVVRAHPDFRIIVTSNTWGRGDDTGMYVNTLTQSIADRRRFHAFIKVDYMPEEDEIRLLMKKFGDHIDTQEAKGLVGIANKIREMSRAGNKIDMPFSPAELINWVEKWLALGDLTESAHMCFLNAQPPEVGVAVKEVIGLFFDPSGDVK